MLAAAVGAVGGGRGAEPGDGSLVPSLGPDGVLAAMGRTSMIKCAI